MANYVTSDGRLTGDNLIDVSTQITASADGTVNIIGAGFEADGGTIVGNAARSAGNALLTIGGKAREWICRADKYVTGTLDQKTYQEGYATNQFILTAPSSCFTPVAPWVPPLFSGPLALLGNPTLLLAVIAVAAAAGSEGNSSDNSYSKNKKTMPVLITDNQELENQLFE